MRTEEVIYENKVLALIIYAREIEEGICFYTSDDNALQVGKHHYAKGKEIKAHKHCPVRIERYESFQEVLYLEEGKVKITFYSDDGRGIDTRILRKGDTILLREGGHGFEFLEKTMMLEVKQGPHTPESRERLEIKDQQ